MSDETTNLQLLRDIAPIISAAVAIVAGSIAYVAIQVQRQIARRRATLDFFIKTDLDSSNFEIDKLANFQKMGPSAKSIERRVAANEPYEMIADDPHYKVVESYLNIHELLAVGIRHEVLDEMICFHYWADALLAHYKDAKPVIDMVRREPGNLSSYAELENLNARWIRMMDIHNRRRDAHRQSPPFYWRN